MSWEIFGDESYIRLAYELAAEADPNAELWYSDYMLESPEKLDKALLHHRE